MAFLCSNGGRRFTRPYNDKTGEVVVTALN